MRRRVLDLRAVAAEHVTTVTDAFGAIVCDRCGRVVRFDADSSDLMLAGIESWGEGPEGDLCPTCVERGS